MRQTPKSEIAAMFLNTLKRHAPVLIFALFTTLCIALASSYRFRIEDDPQVQAANQNLQRIQAAFSAGKVSAGYRIRLTAE